MGTKLKALATLIQNFMSWKNGLKPLPESVVVAARSVAAGLVVELLLTLV